MNPNKQKHEEESLGGIPEGYELPDGWEDEEFKIDDTPENVAKALFKLNPNEKGFGWKYLKKDEGLDSRV